MTLQNALSFEAGISKFEILLSSNFSYSSLLINITGSTLASWTFVELFLDLVSLVIFGIICLILMSLAVGVEAPLSSSSISEKRID